MENRHHELCESPDWMSVCVCVHGLVSLPLKNEQEKTFRIRNSIA